MRRFDSRTTTRITTARAVTATTQQRLARAAAASSLLLVGGALLLGNDAFACRDGDVHASHQPSANTKSTASVPSKQVVAAAHHGHASHTGDKANGSGVSLESKTAKSIPVGVASIVTLDFGPARIEGAVARVRAPDGVAVTMADGSALRDIALAVGQPTRVDLMVTARNDGRQYLDVTTVQDARSSVRSVALPIGSNEVRLKPTGRVETMPNGDRVKVMQAQ